METRMNKMKTQNKYKPKSLKQIHGSTLKLMLTCIEMEHKRVGYFLDHPDASMEEFIGTLGISASMYYRKMRKYYDNQDLLPLIQGD